MIGRRWSKPQSWSSRSTWPQGFSIARDHPSRLERRSRFMNTFTPDGVHEGQAGEVQCQRAAGGNVFTGAEQPIGATKIELAGQHQAHAVGSDDPLDAKLSHHVAPGTRAPPRRQLR